MADRPVYRWLFSVDPDPERTRPESGSQVPPPDVLRVIQKAVAGIPRYQSIQRDLEKLDEHQSNVRRLNSIIKELRPEVEKILAAPDPKQHVEEEALYEVYLKQRYNAVVDDITNRISEASRNPDPAMLPVILNGVVATLGTEFSSVIEKVDWNFEIRKVYWLIKDFETISGGDNPQVIAIRQKLWAQFDRISNLIWETFNGAEGLASSLANLHVAASSAPEIAELVSELVDFVSPVLAGLREETTNLCSAARSGTDASSRYLADREVVAKNFEAWDMFLFPLELITGRMERSQIRFGRITPEAATYIAKPAEQKLAGDALGHFGGFLDRKWRENDIMWGRLDTAELLVRTLLQTDSRQVPPQVIEQEIHLVQREVAARECPPAVANGADYKDYLEREYSSDWDFAKLPQDYRMRIGLRIMGVLARLMNATTDTYKGPVRKLLKIATFILNLTTRLLRYPVEALWGRDPLLRRAITAVLLFIGGWGILLLVFLVMGIVTGGTTAFSVAVGMVVPLVLWAILRAVVWRHP